MKFGIRKPSLKKSISAMTRGAITRDIMRAINPSYGKKGVGILHPSRYSYNKLYDSVTVSSDRIIDKLSKSNLESADESIDMKILKINKKEIGLNQCDILNDTFKLVCESNMQDFILDAFNVLMVRENSYLSKGLYFDIDFYTYAKTNINTLKTAKSLKFQTAIQILNDLESGISPKEIVKKYITVR
jgi:hypothetical protein